MRPIIPRLGQRALQAPETPEAVVYKCLKPLLGALLVGRSFLRLRSELNEAAECIRELRVLDGTAVDLELLE